MATRTVIVICFSATLIFARSAYCMVDRPGTAPPPPLSMLRGISAGPHVLSYSGDTTWVQAHTGSTCCPGDPSWGHGGEATGGPGPAETWCFENAESCACYPPWDTNCFDHVDVRTFPSPMDINYWHIDTYTTDEQAYLGDYCLWCGSDSLWDGAPVECGTWVDTPGYGNLWNCYVRLTLPDTFAVAGGCTLLFDPRYDTECKYDYFYLDVWNGTDWITLATFNASSGNPGSECGTPTGGNPDYWANTDTGQPASATWEPRFDPGLPAFYRVITPDTLGVTSGPCFRWRVTSDGSWSDADGRGDTDGAAFLDNVWVWGDNSRYEEDFESGVLDTNHWSLPDPDGVADTWHLVHDSDPPYEGGDGGDRTSCITDSSWFWRARPEGGYPGPAEWRNGWFTRLMSPRVPIVNSGCVFQFDMFCCTHEYTCDYANVVVRVYNSEYDRWCPWMNIAGYWIYCSCYFWSFDHNDDVSPFFGDSADSIQYAWDFMDLSSPGDFCRGQHKNSDFTVDNVSVGFFDATSTYFRTRGIDLLHDTFLTGICGYNSAFDAYNEDTVSYYSGVGAPPLRSENQLRIDIIDSDGIASARLYGSRDDGATWVWNDLTLEFVADPSHPERGGEYYGTLCPSDFGLSEWDSGTVVWHYIRVADDLANVEYYPPRANPGHPYHSGDEEDYLTFTILPRYPATYEGPRILLVDGYGRKNHDWSPCLSRLDNQMQLDKIYDRILVDAGYCYDRFDISGAGSIMNLAPIRFAEFYDAVIWFTGPYLSSYLFREEAQDSIESYLAGGGKVVLCGDRIAYCMAPISEGGEGQDSLSGEFLGGIMGTDYLEEMPSPFDYPYVYAVGENTVDVFGTPVILDLDTLLVYRECPNLKDMSYVATNASPPAGYTAQPLMYVANPTIAAEDVDEVIYVETTGGGQCVYINFDLCGSVNHERTWCDGDAQEPAPDFTAGTYDGVVELIREILEDLFGLPAQTSGGRAGVGEPPVAYRWHLAQNTPNPCIRATEIRYSLGRRSPVRLVVYDVLGREIRVLEDGVIGAGDHQVVWDGCNGLGERVTSGVYFYRLEAGAYQATRKMLVLR